RPRVAWRGRLRHNHDAAALSGRVSLVVCVDGLDLQRIFIEQEIVAVESVPVAIRAIEWDIAIRRFHGLRGTKNRPKKYRCKNQEPFFHGNPPSLKWVG